MSHPWLLWFLPAVGLLIVWTDRRWGSRTARGNNLVIDEIHEPRQTMEKRWAPMIFLGTLFTHLCGGSAGREGTAVQMGAALADRFAHFFKLNPEQRRTLLISGMGAGFGSAIGAPWAGVVFGMEVLQTGFGSSKRIPQCLFASLAAYLVCSAIGVPHLDYPHPELRGYVGWRVFLWLIPVSVVFGLFAMAFSRGNHFLKLKLDEYFPSTYLKVFFGSLVLVFFLRSNQYSAYQGLGLESIHWNFFRAASWDESVLKGFFTSLTLALGFKGGEFTPLVYMGASLGSFLAQVLELPRFFLVGLGFCAVFAAASKTPITCAIMAAELFGGRMYPYALFVCCLATLSSGYTGIYTSQKIQKTKYWFWDHFR
jgi:H+/Cl- antiporter ClcA